MKIIDDFLFEIFEILDEQDKMESILTKCAIKKVMAKYAVACMHDKELAKEAFEICCEDTKKT